MAIPTSGPSLIQWRDLRVDRISHRDPGLGHWKVEEGGLTAAIFQLRSIFLLLSEYSIIYIYCRLLKSIVSCDMGQHAHERSYCSKLEQFLVSGWLIRVAAFVVVFLWKHTETVLALAFLMTNNLTLPVVKITELETWTEWCIEFMWNDVGDKVKR